MRRLVEIREAAGQFQFECVYRDQIMSTRKVPLVTGGFATVQEPFSFEEIVIHHYRDATERETILRSLELELNAD